MQFFKILVDILLHELTQRTKVFEFVIFIVKNDMSSFVKKGVWGKIFIKIIVVIIIASSTK